MAGRTGRSRGIVAGRTARLLTALVAAAAMMILGPVSAGLAAPPGGGDGASTPSPPTALPPGGADPAAPTADSTFTPTPATSLAADPWAVAVTADGRRAVVAGTGGLQILDLTRSPAVVTGTAPAITGTHVALTPNGAYAYVLDGSTVRIAAVSASTPTLVGTLPNVHSGLRAAVVSPQGTLLYLAYGSGQPDGLPYGVDVMAIAANGTLSFVKKIATQPLPDDIALSPDGGRLISVGGLGSTLSVADTATGANLGTVAIPGSANHVTISPDGRYAYVLGWLYITVSTVDLTTIRVVRSIGELSSSSTGGSGIAVSPDGRYLYATVGQSAGATAVFVLRAADLTLAMTFNGMAYPRGVAVSAAGATRGVAYFVAPSSLITHVDAGFYPLQQSPVGSTPPAVVTVGLRTAPAGQASSTQSITLTATVTGGATPATGTVTFADGGRTLGTVTVTRAGNAASATLTLPPLAAASLGVGTHSLTATYHGDTTHAASTSTATTLTVSYVDVPPGAHFYADIMWLAGTGVTGGFPDGTFRPAQSVTRAQMAAFLYRLEHPGQTPAACTSQEFWDVPVSSQFCAQIHWLAAAGITTGVRDPGHALPGFHPGDPVTRAQMAAFLHRLSQR